MRKKTSVKLIASALCISLVAGGIDLPLLSGLFGTAGTVIADTYTLDPYDDSVYLVSSWEALRDASRDAPDGSTIRLTGDIRVSPTEQSPSCIEFGMNRRITLDLDFHTIEGKGNDGEDYDQLFRITAGELTITGEGEIIEGRARDGGCIQVGSNGSLRIDGATLRSNHASARGGAIYSEGNVEIVRGTITDNRSDNEGGGIYIAGGFLTLWSDAMVRYNSADMLCGGIYVSAGALSLNGGTVTHNRGSGYGYGIYVDEGGAVEIGGGVISVEENSAINDGYFFSDLFLYDGKSIEMIQMPSESSRIGIDTFNTPAYAEPITVATGVTEDYSSCFFSNAGYEVVYDDVRDTVILNNDEVCTWSQLQNALNAGGLPVYDESLNDYVYIVRLSNNITAGSHDETLEFKYTSHPVILDLNGYTIDRNLEDMAENGSVINMTDGELTIRDRVGGGLITGGKSHYGGGIRVFNSVLTLEGGTITGNIADYGGGVCIDTQGHVIHKGTTITGNTAGIAAGVYTGGEEYTVSSNAQVTGNKDSLGRSSDVFLNSSVISIADDLSESAAIGICALDERSVITDGFADVFESVDLNKVFFTDDESNCLYLNDDHEVVLDLHHELPEEADWEWAEDRSSANIILTCPNCGEVIVMAEVIPTGPVYDQDSGKVVFRASYTYEGMTYTSTDICEPQPDLVEKVVPSVDEEFRYVPGIRKHYELILDETTYYFESVNGVLGEMIDDPDLLTYYDLHFESSTVRSYSGPLGEDETIIEIPAMTDEGIPLETLGNGVPFIEAFGATSPVTIFDHGNIKRVYAGSFAGIDDLLIVLNTEDEVTITGDFSGSSDITIRCHHDSGLTTGYHEDGNYTVEYLEDHTYEVVEGATVFAEDYESAYVLLRCSCGDEQVVYTEDITVVEDENDHTFTITANAEYLDNDYTSTLEDVPSFTVTVRLSQEQGAREFSYYVPRCHVDGQFSQKAFFYFNALGVTGVIAPACSVFSGWTDGTTVYSPDGIVEITGNDKAFMPEFTTEWSRVAEALAEGNDVKLYSDITPAAGDSYLYVPAGESVTLDLNGFTINRNLTNAATDGYVIRVEGDLVVKNGTIRGGNNTGNGGGFLVEGDLVLIDADVMYNNADNGAGIFIDEGGDVKVLRGNIMYNTAAEYGGGVYVSPEAEFLLTTVSSDVSGLLENGPSGSAAVIENNVAGVDGGGVYIRINGKSSFNGAPQVVNNTTGSAGGAFSNICPEVGATASQLTGMIGILAGITVGAILCLSFKTIAVYGAFIVGAILIVGTVAIVTYFVLDVGKKREGDTDTDQRDAGLCPHTPERVAAWTWKEDDYSKCDATLVCPVCGHTIHREDLVPVISTDSDSKVTTYSVSTTDDKGRDYSDSRRVAPYVVTLRNEDAYPEQEETHLVSHLQGAAGEFTLNVPPSFVNQTSAAKPKEWKGDGIGETRQIDEVVAINRDKTYTIKWTTLVTITYDKNAEDATGKMEDGKAGKEEDYEFSPCGFERTGYFFVEWEIVKAGEVIDHKKPGEKIKRVETDLTAKAVWKSKWQKLDENISAYVDDLPVNEDLTATSEDTRLSVANDKDVTVLLNNHTLNRNMSSENPGAAGNVMSVAGKIALSNGTLKGGALSGGNGGGISLSSGAVLSLTGVTITGNSVTGGNGGGLYVPSGATVKISGKTVITGNTSVTGETAAANNVYLADGAVLTVTGALTSDAKIGVTMANPGVITSGLNGKGNASNFVSDDDRYVVGINEQGEACLYAKVEFDKGDEGATGSMDPVELAPGSEYELPGCDFAAPEGKQFKEWSVKIGDSEAVTKNPSDVITVTANTTVTAVWEESAKPAFRFQSLLLSGQIGVVFYLELPGEIADYEDSVMTFEVSGKTQTVPFSEYRPGQRQGKDYYGFVCRIGSIQMAETITATFTYGDGKTITKEYSAKAYIDAVKGATGYKDYEINLFKAIADMGHYVQPFLGKEHHWTPGDKYQIMPMYDETMPIDSEMKAAATEGVRDFKMNSTISKEGCKLYYSLFLESETSIAVYLKADGSSDITATVDGAAADVTFVKGCYQVKMNNIPAHQLGKKFVVVYYEGGEEIARTEVTALSYVYSVLWANEGTYDEDAVNAVTSLYYYYLRTIEYREHTNAD